MANEPSIEQMNEAIARFMGGTRVLHPEQKFFNEDFYGYVCHDGRWWNEKCLKYHTSWDWLMPVGKKIYDLLAEMAKQRPPHTACHGDVIEVDITCHIREYNITGAHKSIYEFTQWFNQQKQNDDK